LQELHSSNVLIALVYLNSIGNLDIIMYLLLTIAYFASHIIALLVAAIHQEVASFSRISPWMDHPEHQTLLFFCLRSTMGKGS